MFNILFPLTRKRTKDYLFEVSCVESFAILY